tara:strand:- start:1300 stop:2346 length:1047 start_codon:yes stop_codon:yes gene_type:complete
MNVNVCRRDVTNDKSMSGERMMKTVVWLMMLLTFNVAVAQVPEFDALMDDADQVAESEQDELTGGDKKVFKVTTDVDISSLEVGDIYKNNTSFFRVTKVGAKGARGGSFRVERSAGTQEPMRYWTRVSGLGPTSIAGRETLWDRFRKGGPLMYPIALLLLAVIVVAINSGMVYRGSKQCPDGFVDQAADALTNEDLPRFENLASQQEGLLAAICRRMVFHFEDSTEEDIRVRCESEARKQIGFLRMPLRGLTFIAAVAPLLGLLGTVVGMIACFDSLASDAPSAGKAQLMASGIKIALLTTAFGLCVAVPALFVFFTYNLKLNTLIADCEGTVAEFVHKLARIKRKAE